EKSRRFTNFPSNSRPRNADLGRIQDSSRGTSPRGTSLHPPPSDECRRGDKDSAGKVAVTGLLLALLVCAAAVALTSRLEARGRWWVLALLLAATIVGLRLTRARTMLTLWPTPTEVERVAR